MRLIEIICDCNEKISYITFAKSLFKYLFLPIYCREKIALIIRGGMYFRQKGYKFIQKYFEYKLLKKFNCQISCYSTIGYGLWIPHPVGIVIGSGVCIGKNLTIYQNVTVGQNMGKYPHIGNDVIIYPGAKIIGDVVIGDNAIIGANAVVNHNVEKKAIVAGVPARKIGERIDELYF